MTDSQAKQIQEIQALLSERRKYEEWIAHLEARQESTPPHVFTKVRSDYGERLAEAQAKLSAETGVVEKLVTELESSLAAHERLVGAKKDERAEAELRAVVGEYSEKEWDKLRTKLDGAIADLSGERDGFQRELGSLQSLLSEVSGPVEPAPEEMAEEEAAPPPPPPAPAAPVGKLSDAPALRGSGAMPRPAEPAGPSGAAGRKSDVDELAFLRSVLGRTTPYTGAGGLPAVKESAPPPAEAAPRKSGAVPRPSGAIPRPSSTTGPVRASGAVSTTESAPFAVPEPPMPESRQAAPDRADGAPRQTGAFGQPTPRSSEALRSLKCQECGTLNFPTEWYCERCGGELAAF